MLKKEVTIPLIISIAFALFLFFLQTDSGAIKFGFDRINQISDLSKPDENLKMFFKNKKINTPIYSTHFDVWNDGNLTVRNENVLIDFSIESELDNYLILDATVEQTTRDAISFSIDTSSFSNGSIKFEWDFLQPGDGARIYLLFTTTTASSKLFRDYGGRPNEDFDRKIFNLKGSSDYQNNLHDFPEITNISNGVLIIGTASLIIIDIVLLVGLYFYYKKFRTNNNFESLSIIILSIIMFLMGNAILWEYLKSLFFDNNPFA